MNLVLLIVIFVLIIVVIVAAIIALVSVRSGNKQKSEIHFLDGADVDSGRLSADNNFFRGFSDVLGETVVVGGEKTRSTGVAVSIKNRSEGAVYRMTLARELVIGREAALTVCDRAVSRQHCKISVSGGKLYLSDLSSANHTYLNGKRLSDTVELNSGDLIRIGNTVLEIIF